MSLQPGQTLSHYRLVEKIGEGGMGVVWKAEDTVLGRTVAIKVLPPEFLQDEERHRMFLQEARLASSVSEAHIAQVHEFGKEGDLEFIVMEHVEGTSLNRMLQGRPLSLDKLVDFGFQIAQALSGAHRKKLLHRDLKPENILVTPEDVVKVVDFGLAILFERVEHRRGPDEITRLTLDDHGSSRKLAGTLTYMSPEQVRLEPLDARSDIFSMGIILYEMTTGRPPFSGATSRELLQNIEKAHPCPVHQLVPTVPLELDRIIQKALAARRRNRYQTMEDLAVDLKRLGDEIESGSSPSYEDLRATRGRTRLWAWGSAGLLVLVAAVFLVWRVGPWVPSAISTDRTILILPFEVRGQEEDPEYVGRIFAEEIAGNLAQAEDLSVLPVPWKSLDPDADALALAESARKVHAGRVVTGSVTRDGPAVHASLNLVDSQNNRILWRVEKTARDGELQTLATMLSQELGVELGATFPRLFDHWRNATGSQTFVSSLELAEVLAALRRSDISMVEASARLVEKFPLEYYSHVLRSKALTQIYRDTPEPSNRLALEEALAALDELERDSPHSGSYRAKYIGEQGRPGEAINRFTELLGRTDLTPSLRAEILVERAEQRSKLGDFDAALADLEVALALSPAWGHVFIPLSMTLRRAGRPAEAITPARQAIIFYPERWVGYAQLGAALAALERWQGSLAPFMKACDMSGSQEACGAYAFALQKAGETETAVTVADDASTLAPSSLGAYNLACYHALVGQRSFALRWLEQALELGYLSVGIKRDPDLDSLRGDPEFEAIVAEVEKRLQTAQGD